MFSSSKREPLAVHLHLRVRHEKDDQMNCVSEQTGVLHSRMIRQELGYHEDSIFSFYLITFDTEESSNLLLWQYKVDFQCSQGRVGEWGGRRGRSSPLYKNTFQLNLLLRYVTFYTHTHTHTQSYVCVPV